MKRLALSGDEAVAGGRRAEGRTASGWTLKWTVNDIIRDNIELYTVGVPEVDYIGTISLRAPNANHKFNIGLQLLVTIRSCLLAKHICVTIFADGKPAVIRQFSHDSTMARSCGFSQRGR